jgi:hypothetical protein
VFDETVQMPGRQNKYQHIADRTFLRPRDIIKFCNTILGEAKKRTATKQEDRIRFVNADIHKAREEYSSYFLREIDDEIHKHVPNYKKYLDVIKSVGVYRFDLESFKNEFERHKNEFPEITEPIQLLKTLHSFSIISFYRAGGRGFGGSEYISKHKYPDEEFDLLSTSFQVHPGLIEVLGLKKYEK